MPKKVVVVGTGYVGLPLAIMLARAGHEVVGVDIQQETIDEINSGELHISEEAIRRIFQEPEVRKNLKAQKVPCSGDVFIISVPTPLDERRRVADLDEVIQATQSIVPYLAKGNLVVLESTVPPLTCRGIVIPILEKTGLKASRDFFVCHCPERILPGDVFREIVHNDRIVGGVDKTAALMARDVYASFVKGSLILTDDVTAELAKLMENAYRDVNIALANEFASVAEGLGLDPLECIRLANRHPRVKILHPGIGTGGHCIPIDPWFIKEVDPVNSRLIQTARAINDERPRRIAAEVRRAVRGLPSPTIVTLGLTYKPDTYDRRNSPASEIIADLREDGYRVESYDPWVEGHKYSLIKEIAAGADCLVVLVEHQLIKSELARDEAAIKNAMRHPIIVRFYIEEGD